jgi:subtilisin family serine protease
MRIQLKVPLLCIPLLFLPACDGEDLLTTPIVPEEIASDQAQPVEPQNDPRGKIVVLKPGFHPQKVAQDHGVSATHSYSRVLNGFAGRVGELARQGLMKDHRVVRVESDLEVTTTVVPGTTDGSGVPWGLDRIDQRQSDLDGLFSPPGAGRGVDAYIVDTGIWFGESEFSGRAVPGFDFEGSGGSDCAGHGTHVSGILGGTNFGVAKEVNLISVRVLDCEGRGSVSDILAGLDWIAGHAAGPSVVNMSLRTGASEALDEGVQSLIDFGVSVVVAAGNDRGNACWYSPSRVPDAMTVGATDALDQRAEFSNFGECVDWFAPGVDILSISGGGLGEAVALSGTSMASPHTAGVAALVLEADPTLTPHEVREILWARSTKEVVFDAFSTNPHLLSSLAEVDEVDGILPDEPLTAPTNLVATPSPDQIMINLTWNDTDPRTEVVEIWMRQEAGEWAEALARAVGEASIVFAGLLPATTYEFRVRGRRGPDGFHQVSAWTDPASATTCDGNPKNGRCSKSGDSTKENNKGGKGKGKG